MCKPSPKPPDASQWSFTSAVYKSEAEASQWGNKSLSNIPSAEQAVPQV